MATIKDLIRRTNRLVDDVFDNIDLIDWFNDCNDDMEGVIYTPEIATINIENGEADLPENYKDRLEVILPDSEIRLEKISSDDLYNPGYYIIGNKLFVRGYEDLENIKIIYNRKLNRLTNTPDLIPEIPSQFHYLYTLFASAQAMLADEEPERFEYFHSKYDRGRSEVVKFMNNKKKSSQTNLKWRVVR